MKIYKRYSAAAKAADGMPIVTIRNGGRKSETMYVVGFGDLVETKLTEISLLVSGHTTGNITLSHLDRLGNANHAEPHPSWTNSRTAFPKA